MAFDLRLLLCAGLVGLILRADAGTIEGRVTARGKELPADAAAGDYQSRKFRFAERVDYEQLHGFVVSIDGPPKVALPKPDKPLRVVVQQNAVFSPHVLPVQVGTTVEWPNEDDIYHNVFSFSEAKPFDLGLYKDEVKRITFDTPGRVDVFCSIHKNMNCIILVQENPWFAAADAKGDYIIRDVPAGTYRLRAWHERLPPLIKDITAPAEGAITVDFEMGVQGIPRY